MKNIFSEIREKGHDEDFIPTLASEHTDHAAGSWGKICVLEARVRRGESLWHPGDNPMVCTYEQQQEACELIKPYTLEGRKSREAMKWAKQFIRDKKGA